MSASRTFLRRSSPLLMIAAGAVGGLAWLGARPAHAALARNDAIEHAMQQLQQSMKTLGKGISAESQAAALAELVKVEQALLSAKVETPDTAAAVDEKKRPAFVAEFRTTLLEALKLVCDAEIAVVNGKYKDAEAILRGKLGALKSGGHDKFKGEDKEK